MLLSVDRGGGVVVVYSTLKWGCAFAERCLLWGVCNLKITGTSVTTCNVYCNDYDDNERNL